MIGIDYSLGIEATEERELSGFYSPDLEGLTGIGDSAEDRLSSLRWGSASAWRSLREQGLPVPARNPDSRIVFQNEGSDAELAVA